MTKWNFDKIFHKEQEWKDISLINKNPCRKCKVHNRVQDLAFCDPIEDCKECSNCTKFLAWQNKCILKLAWYEKQDDRLKGE